MLKLLPSNNLRANTPLNIGTSVILLTIKLLHEHSTC